MSTVLNAKTLAKAERQLQAQLLKEVGPKLTELVHSVFLSLITTPSTAKADHWTPAPGGKCDAVWKEMDALTKKNKGVPVTRQKILEIGAAKGWEPNNNKPELLCLETLSRY